MSGMAAFDEPVDYDDAGGCDHRETVDVADMGDPAERRMCTGCGATWNVAAAGRPATASLASPVAYRRCQPDELVDTIDGRVHASEGDYLLTHADGRRKLLPAVLFEALYWPDPDGREGGR